MTQLSRERVEEIAELARKANYKPCAMHMTNLIAVCDSEVIEEMARRLLAAEAQEPVAWEVKGILCHTLDEAKRYVGQPEPLYTAPPAPVRIDERAAFNAWNNDENLPIAGVGAKNAAWLAWQARAAMLQGGK